jgi:hypothetical protein
VQLINAQFHVFVNEEKKKYVAIAQSCQERFFFLTRREEKKVGKFVIKEKSFKRKRS